jgi:hypothetical protein
MHERSAVKPKQNIQSLLNPKMRHSHQVTVTCCLKKWA